MIKFDYEKEKAIMFTLDIKGGLQEYALSFLHIVNNAREYPNTIYKVQNTSSNVVHVTCPVKKRDEVKSYLLNFGEMLYETEVNRINIIPEFGSKEFDELYGGDCEVQFNVECD